MIFLVFSLRVYGETTVDTFQSSLPRTLLEYSITLIDRFATLSRDHCLLSIGNHVKVTSLVSRDHPFLFFFSFSFFIPLYLSLTDSLFPLLKDAFADRYRAAIDFSRLSLPMSHATTCPTTTESTQQERNSLHDRADNTLGNPFFAEGREKKKEAHARYTPMDGEIRRDAGWRRRDDTHKRVQRRNCRFVDTRPVYYLPTGEPRWGKLGETRTRMRNGQLVHSNLAIGIDTVARSTKLDGMVPVEKSTTTGESNCPLAFFRLLRAVNQPFPTKRERSCVLEAVDRKGCLMIVLSKNEFSIYRKVNEFREIVSTRVQESDNASHDESSFLFSRMINDLNAV